MPERPFFIRRVLALLAAYPHHVTEEEFIRYAHYYIGIEKRMGWKT